MATRPRLRRPGGRASPQPDRGSQPAKALAPSASEPALEEFWPRTSSRPGCACWAHTLLAAQEAARQPHFDNPFFAAELRAHADLVRAEALTPDPRRAYENCLRNM